MFKRMLVECGRAYPDNQAFMRAGLWRMSSLAKTVLHCPSIMLIHPSLIPRPNEGGGKWPVYEAMLLCRCRYGSQYRAYTILACSGSLKRKEGGGFVHRRSPLELYNTPVNFCIASLPFWNFQAVIFMLRISAAVEILYSTQLCVSLLSLAMSATELCNYLYTASSCTQLLLGQQVAPFPPPLVHCPHFQGLWRVTQVCHSFTRNIACILCWVSILWLEHFLTKTVWSNYIVTINKPSVCKGLVIGWSIPRLIVCRDKSRVK